MRNYILKILQFIQIFGIQSPTIKWCRTICILQFTFCILQLDAYALDPNKAITQYVHDVWQTEQGLPQNSVLTIIQTRDGYIYLGTQEGLVRFDGVKFTVFDKTNTPEIKHNTIWSLYEDREGSLWIGTNGGGLNRYRDGKFTSYTTKEGLFDDVVFQILEDSKSNLWMSCNKGIYRVNKNELNDFADGKIKSINCVSYGTADGMKSRECNGGTQPAGWKTRDEKLWFPTIKGVVMIDPENIKINEVIPLVVIENVVVDGEREKLNFLEKFNFSPGKEKFEFHYTALSFLVPERVKFKYKLEGFDKEWVDAVTRRVAYYTNIPPGDYKFKVIASNNDGIWNEAGAEFNFYLEPYFYQTYWFYTLCILMVAGIGFGGYRLRIRQLKEHQKKLIQLVEQRTATIKEQSEKLMEMDQVKTRFFSNISHEFRTPLTLILGHIENALSGVYGNVGENFKNQLDIMSRNSRRLLRLINQLLDISKLDAGKMELQARRGNIVKFLKEITAIFNSLAERKNITLKFDSEKDNIEIYFDADKLEKVFYNLLSNVFKFTSGGGKIWINVSEVSNNSSEFVEISVKDTGKGIPKEQIPHLFDRFYQVGISYVREREGTGIGLSLVKDLVELHYGNIGVKSELGFGSEFIVTLPKGKNHLKDNQILDEKTDDRVLEKSQIEISILDEIPKDVAEQVYKEISEERVSKNPEIILIIDDNKDVREYVRGIISGQYNIIEAKDGGEGLQKVKEIMPDLILSDVMMPKMDGYELCKILKLDKQLNHIPIILLTAKASEDMKVEGLQIGADDYLSKPFNAKELLARVKNLIKLHNQEKELKIFNKELERKVKEQLDVILKGKRLTKYFSKKMIERIFSTESDVELISERKNVTIFFSDLVGFTDLSDKTEPERITKILNEYMAEMVKIIEGYGGTVARFMGDGIMGFFGVHEEMPTKEQARNAVGMAVSMQKKMKELGRKWLDEGLDHNIKIRIGINQDYATLGNFGSEELMEYTAIGSGVNLASRLEQACSPGKILVSFSIYSLTKEEFGYEELQEKEFKGFVRAIRVCELDPEKIN